VLRAIGGFWEKLRGSGAEDEELAIRALRAGIRFQVLPEPHVWHQDHLQSELQKQHVNDNRGLCAQTWRDRQLTVHPDCPPMPAWVAHAESQET
jgi:GT2 family glycosyltransferase